MEEGLWRKSFGMGRGVVTGPLVVIYVWNVGVAENEGGPEKVENGSASTLGRLGEGCGWVSEETTDRTEIDVAPLVGTIGGCLQRSRREIWR